METQENQEKNEAIRPENVPAPANNPAAVKPSSVQKPTVSIAAAIITGAAMIALALIIVLHSSSTAPAAATAPAAQAAQTAPQPTMTPDSSKVNTAGEPYIGSATAPVTMAYWFDYQCPFCREDEETVLPEIITNYVDTGKVKIVFKDYAFLGPDSDTLGEYARAVWAVDPAKFYTWHKAIFDNQGTENTGWATQSKITSITTSVLGASETAKVSQLVATDGSTYLQEMNADKTEGTAFGIQGTPAAIIGTQLITGAEPYATFQTAINAALAIKQTNS